MNESNYFAVPNFVRNNVNFVENIVDNVDNYCVGC
jgi:hypothetical protein